MPGLMMIVVSPHAGCTAGAGASTGASPAGLRSTPVVAGGMTALRKLPDDQGLLAARGRQVLGVTPQGEQWLAFDGEPPTPASIITDFCLTGRDLVLIWGDEAVDRCRPAGVPAGDRVWRTTRRWTAEELGLLPRSVTAVNTTIYITGEGGVVNLDDGTRMLDGMTINAPVCATALGPVACEGRRAYTIHDGAYVGSASRVQRDGDALIFLRRSAEHSEFGFMDLSLRERDVRTHSASTERSVHAVHRDQRGLVVLCDDVLEFHTLHQANGREWLALARVVPLAGARHAVPHPGGVTAVAGARGLCAVSDGRDRTPDVIVTGIGEITASAFDGRLLRTAGGAGDVVFDLDGTLLDEPIPGDIVSTRSRHAQSLEFSISLRDGFADWTTSDGRSATINVDVTADYGSVVIVDGDAWIGHRRGVTVIVDNGTNTPDVLSSRDLARVIDVHPLLDGTGVVAVSDMLGVRMVRR
jgi:hypothetical protein